MITMKGTINGFSGSWGSGIGYLVIDERPVPCENGATVRALAGAFPGFISAGHCVDNQAIAGKEIVYSVDELGMLANFTPAEDWAGPEIPPEGLADEGEV